MTTMSPGRNVGASTCRTEATNKSPLTAPSITKGAVRPLARKAATKVVGFQCP